MGQEELAPGGERERAEVRRAVAAHLREGARVEVTEHGLRAARSDLKDEGFRAALAVLRERGPVRVFDFNLARDGKDETRDRWAHEACLARNLHDGERFRDDYAGDRQGGGAPVFFVDHHYEVEALARESTTPMVRRWVLGLHDRGLGDVIAALAGARYLVNHWDPDILLAQHLGAMAADRAYIGEVGRYLAAAALRNDYLDPPPADVEPLASRAYYACLAIEKAMQRGEVSSYAEAHTRWMPAIGAWVGAGAKAGDAAGLSVRADAARRDERAALARVGTWEREGRLHLERGGRLVWLDAPAEIDNALLYLYLQERHPLAGPRVQLLSYPEPRGEIRYKVRAHGGFDLHDAFARLRERLPAARFGGRSAAGGSHPCAPQTDAVLAILRDAIGPAESFA